jgi:integrase/recombinase XerD
LIGRAGDRAARRFVEFFTVNIRNRRRRHFTGELLDVSGDMHLLYVLQPGNPLPFTQVSKGVTPVLSSEEATALLTGMDVSSVVGLRDRAIIAVMTYTFARVGAVVALTVEDYYARKKRWWLRLREKNGKVNEMPCHHKLEEYLDAYIKAAGIEGDRKGPLFRAAIGKTKKLGQGAISRTDVWYMVSRRASDAGIETAIGCHTFRATGITIT